MPEGDLLLDKDGELVFVNGDLQLCTGIQCVVQDVETRLKFFLGEDFLDVEGTGTPWYQVILGVKGFDQANVAKQFALQILGAPDIVEILQGPDITFDGKTRLMTVNWQAETSFGTTPFIQSLFPVPQQ